MKVHTEQVLENFGLTNNEIKVYLAALRLGETSPFELARETGIPRTTVYDVLMNLSFKGLVTLTQSDGYTKQQTKIKAKNPSTLRELIHQKQKKLASLDVDLVDILPDLKTAFQKNNESADFRLLPGIEGAKEVYFADHVADNPLPIVAFENMMSMDAFGKTEVNLDTSRSTAKRIAVNSPIRELIGLTDWTRHVLTYQYARDPHYIQAREMRCLESPTLFLNQRIVIQGNRISMSCVDGDEAWGMRLNSASLAKTFSTIFEAIWTFATPITDTFVKNLGQNAFFIEENDRSPVK